MTPAPKRPRTCASTIHSTALDPTPSLTNYSEMSSPGTSTAIYIRFQRQVLACGNSDHRTLEQVLFDQWGVPGDAIYFTMEGKVLGHGITCDRSAVGSTVVARGRLRGGTGAALRKLRGLLQEKGVPMEQLDSRLEEIRSHVGEKGIKEAYDVPTSPSTPGANSRRHAILDWSRKQR